MAILKDTVVSGSLRATDTVYADTVQTKTIEAPTASNGTTYGPGTSGQVLKSNGSSVYWAADNNAGGTVTSVRVQATSPVTSSVNTAQSATLNTTIALADGYGDTKNPYASKAKNVVLAGPSSGNNAAPTFRALVANDLPDASTSAQGVVQLSDAINSTSTTLAATANAVKKAYDLANGKTANTGTVTKVSTGAGLTGGDITTTGTVKANLTSETKLTNAAADGTEISGRVYPVRLDKNGKLAVNVPWTNANSSYLTAHQTIKQDGITGATANRFGTCSTAGGTAAKAVSITSGTFNLEAGARVSVKFSNANTANTPTLNVNSKGAKNIFHRGAQITSGANKALLAGTVEFVYDGTQWHLLGNYYDTTSIPAENITSGYLNIHPENSPVVIPMINNDIAFLLKRGGSAVVQYDGTTQNVDISAVFDGSPSYWAINPTNVTTVTITLTLHQAFSYSNTIYVDFGNSGWRSKSVKIEVMNSGYADDTWSQKGSITNNSLGHYSIGCSHAPTGGSSGNGFNMIRLTFSDWATASIFRIAAIGVYNYGSRGLRETFLPRDGGDLYGGLTPYSNSTYDLGSTSKYWKNAYLTQINGVAVGSSPKFTDTTYENKAAASGGTAVSLVTTGEKYTWNAKTSNTGTVTKVSTGAGLTGGDITSTGTVKAALTSETKLTNAAADGTETSGRVYPVRLDKNGKLAVNVPWTNVNSSYLTSSSNLNADKLSSGTVPVARLPDASTSAQGVVQLSDATNSTSTSLAATANAVKKAYDLANGKTANTGTVTSVKLIQGNNITINSSGTAITTSGERTISLSNVQQPLVAASSTAATQTSPYKPSLWAFNLGVAASSLATGMMVTVKIPVATTTYGSFISIDNGTTYKPIAVGTGTARMTTHYAVDDVVTLFYDAAGSVTTYALAGATGTSSVTGGCWRVLNYYDSGNSNDTSTMYMRRGHGTFAPTTALYSYELCLQSFADNAKLIPVNTTQKSTANSKTTITTAEFDPFADIIYYSRDATVNANTNIDVSYVWLAYSLIDLRYSFNTASTLTANKDVYIVAKMQDNGSAKLRNPGATGNNAAATATGASAGPITQTLPTSDDGYIYIKLGRAYDSYRCSTDYHHQIYWYKNGKVRLYPDTGCPITKYGPSSAFSSLPVTFEDDSITADMVVLNYVLSNPTAQINNWTVTTAAGSLTISGQVRGSTTITLYLGRCEQEA